ncbi:hypothetical protein [Patiriisocius hiemis]|uniref:Uncharacterized protein n=1 Tax=Patiriisocius hiemis TaxID=3075604 RepID=A0ABU2YAD9_9FLAO|nr:hypothetical protein [Constantimarinum sp. W242]MDT0554702.1 hypothetical protein [Constantimarinum sp. W242]
MKEKIKLLWDFRGPNAQKIAQHHVVHLKEYITLEKLEDTTASFEDVSNMYAIAFIITRKQYFDKLKNALKPHRGQVYKETK